jgi:hypothetical protein
MSVTSIEERRRDRSSLGAPRRVVAVILQDGTVRPVGEGSDDAPGARTLARGQLSGPDWVLWWERRSWSRRP